MQFELEIIKGLQSISNGFLNFLASAISFLGEQYMLIIMAAVIYFIINKEFGETFCFTTLFSNTTPPSESPAHEALCTRRYTTSSAG